MNNAVFLSVVIPVYKVEPYLNQCVDSVLSQNLYDIEIILVDDGSPDSSPAICDRYAEEYDCIRVIHKPNGGLSSARNAGIEAAQGEYLMFMDSDDWWNPDVDMRAVLNQVRTSEKVEMFLLSSLDYIEGEGYFKRSEHENLKNIPTDSVRSYYQGLLNNGNLEVSACTKIIRREFIRKNRLFFKPGLLGEDNEWMIRLLRNLKSVRIIDQPLYMCRGKREGSITATIGRKNIEDILNIISSSINYYSQDQVSTDVKEQEYCFCAYLWFCALGLCSGLSQKEQRELKPLFLKTKSVCAYSSSRKTRLANTCLRLLGYPATLFLLGQYIKLKGKANLNKHKVG